MIKSASLLITLAIITPAGAQASPIEVIISGVQPFGKILGQVFADQDSFKSREKPVLRFAIDTNGQTSIRTTITLQPGRYAIALFQDIRGNGKIETNFFGKPLVPYGFSNNAASIMGPPGFDAATFEVNGKAVTLPIQLR